MSTKTTSEWVDHAKRFCHILEAARIVRVEGNYDGSGDSGDMNLCFFRERQTVLPGNRPPPGVHQERLYEREGKALLTEGDKPLATKEAFDEFVTAMWHLLPGGWEINDGSFGEVTLDVETREITVQHNERYTDVNSSTHKY